MGVLKWVLIVWTLWSTNGVPTVDVKSTEIYYPSKHTCEMAMEDFTRRYEPYTEKGFGYILQCREKDGVYIDMGEEGSGPAKTE